MATVEKIRERLSKLTNTANSIQTFSQWLIHHSHKNSDLILDTWLKEIKASKDSERLITLINLANDVIQNSRKKNPHFMANFFSVLHPAMIHISEYGSESCKRSVQRVLNVWRERNVYTAEKVEALSSFFTGGADDIVASTPPLFCSDQEQLERECQSPTENIQKSKREFQNFSSLSTQLVNVIRKLEDPASADAKIRQLIASYPESIANPASVKKIRTHDEMQSLKEKINEANPIVDAYCNRLKDELKDRQNAQYILVDYLKALSDATERTKALANAVKRRIAILDDEKHEVAKHIESLPDLNRMFGENTSSSLPTLGELFT